MTFIELNYVYNFYRARLKRLLISIAKDREKID